MTNLVLRGSWIFDMRTDLLHYSMCFTSLSLYLLVMLTTQIKCKSICSEEGVLTVKQIAVELSKVENDCVLYTPTVEDYRNCSKSTLECFELELKVLFDEIQSVTSLFPKLLQILKKQKNQLQDNVKSCPDCELYREERAETFLETLQNFLQWMNAENCGLRNVKRHLDILTL